MTDNPKLLPPPADVCSQCATDHGLDEPHNAQSLFYQYKFFAEHGRWPTWGDAMTHCSAEVQELWREELLKRGVPEDQLRLSGSRGE